MSSGMLCTAEVALVYAGRVRTGWDQKAVGQSDALMR
jgi:hypothetical protein